MESQSAATNSLPHERHASVAEGCRRLGALLDLDGPVPQEVFLRALRDDEYARTLFFNKGSRALLERLMRHPPQLAAPGEEEGDLSTPALIARASRAFWHWASSGFAMVDETIYVRRFDACLACPDLAAPPPKAVYALAGADPSSDRVCRLCGCIVRLKARLPHEHCPAEDPARPGVNRWGESLARSA